MRFASQQIQNMTPDQIKQTLDKVGMSGFH